MKTSRNNRASQSLLTPYFKRIITFFFSASFLALLMIAVYWAWVKVHDPKTFPFRQIKVVTRANHINTATLQKIISQHVHGGFFSLDLARLRRALDTLPWVFSVSIRRIWPETLYITVNEQHAIAHWNKQGVINRQGLVFYPPVNSIPQNLPSLIGPADATTVVLNHYQLFNPQVKPLGLTIYSLDLTPRLAWELVLSNGIKVMLGREDVEHRFARFVQLYPRLIGNQGNRVLRVDLRYPNGLAIRWRGKPVL